MTLLDKFRFAWWALTILAVWLEFAAIGNSIRNDTLSERVAWIQDLPYVGLPFRCLLCAFLFWLMVHFVTAEASGRRVSFWWDGRHLIVILVAGVGVWAIVQLIRFYRLA